MRAFWSGAVVVTVTGEPPGTMVAVTSLGPRATATVPAPVLAALGSRSTVYVPAVGSTWVGIEPPPVPIDVEARVEPSGFRRLTVAAAKVELVSVREIRSDAAPAKVRRPFCPGV